jgi:hypothetical protein
LVVEGFALSAIQVVEHLLRKIVACILRISIGIYPNRRPFQERCPVAAILRVNEVLVLVEPVGDVVLTLLFCEASGKLPCLGSGTEAGAEIPYALLTNIALLRSYKSRLWYSHLIPP